MSLNLASSACALATILISSQLQAADLGGSETPINWTGFYIGGNIGYASGSTNVDGTVNSVAAWTAPYASFANANADTNLSPGGFAGGAKAGGNYQFGHIVLGAEVSYDWLNADDSRQTALLSNPGNVGVPGSFYDSVEIDDLFTARGRLGVAIDHGLFYVTGGYASAEVSRTQALLFTNGNNFVTSGSGRQDGWTYGAGFELAFCRNWSLTAEYLRVELDGETLTSTSALGLPQSLKTSADTDIDVLHTGLNYRF